MQAAVGSTTTRDGANLHASRVESGVGFWGRKQLMSRERRSYPRYPVDFSVTATVAAGTPDALACSVVASNISRTSIQFTCSTELLAALLRQPVLPHTCELAFRLPWHAHEFRLTAQVVTHRRLSQQQYVLVLLFRHEDAAQEELLDQLLGQQQRVGLD